MKKVFLVWMMSLCAMVASAQNYGILVNGKMYYAGAYAGIFEEFNQYMSHVQLSSGDYCQLYDVDNKAAWAVPLNSYSVKGFTYDATTNRYNVTVDGCFDFYIKLKWQEDELYIGPGSDCEAGVDITKDTPKPSYKGAAPKECPDVMLQAFYWDSYQNVAAGSPTEVYGRTKWVDFVNKTTESGDTVAAEMGQWFDLIWVPQMSKSTGGLGYHPSNYSILDGNLGTEKNLRKMIDMFHKNGARVIADIVINHADGENGWCSFSTYNFGSYGVYHPDGSYICKTDEVNTSSEAPASCHGWAEGAADDGYGSEANYPSSRDWDHTNPDVQKMFKAYLKWMRNNVKVDGFRYDYCKGYHNSHIGSYNTAAEAEFSVMEMWDGNVETLKSHLNDAAWNTTTFDFATKYTAFNDGIASDNYGNLVKAGLVGAGKGRYAVTFIDSHDGFGRKADDGGNNEMCGCGNSMTICRDKVLMANAYLLSMPGVPCVFWPHWVTFKNEIKAMINGRYKTGVHSESSVTEESGNGYYKATITGTNGQIRLLLGKNSGYNTTPSGFTLAVKGTNYGVYYKTNSPRGDKNTERTDRTQGVEDVQSNGSVAKGEKFIQDGKLYIRCGEQVFDMMGRRVN